MLPLIILCIKILNILFVFNFKEKFLWRQRKFQLNEEENIFLLPCP